MTRYPTHPDLHKALRERRRPRRRTVTTTPTRTPRLQAALDAFGAAMEALGPVPRAQLATQTLDAGGYRSTQQAEAKAVWAAIYALTGGATDERLEHLVSVLEVCGPVTRQALVIISRRAIDGDPPRTDVWRTLLDLADAVVE